MPLFVTAGQNIQRTLKSPGARAFSLDLLLDETARLCDLGIDILVLYELTEAKDRSTSHALQPASIMERAISTIKRAHPKLLLVCDLCLCHYSSDGHCGIYLDSQFRNDPSLDLIEELAKKWADSGCDVLMLSGMLDGGVATIRSALHSSGHSRVAIMNQSAKHASALFGPFRKNIASSASEATKGSYQLDPCNRAEALREIFLDIQEGVDYVVIKPALFGLDLLYAARQRFTVPLVAFLTSGEHVLLEELSNSCAQPRLDVIAEAFGSLARAGAGMIISYFAAEFIAASCGKYYSE